jgi:hypothetical protein
MSYYKEKRWISYISFGLSDIEFSDLNSILTHLIDNRNEGGGNLNEPIPKSPFYLYLQFQ